MNFCDSPLYSPLRRLTHAGRIRPERAMEIINACLLSFFQTYLNGHDDHLLVAPCPRYPEVEIGLTAGRGAGLRKRPVLANDEVRGRWSCTATCRKCAESRWSWG